MPLLYSGRRLVFSLAIILVFPSLVVASIFPDPQLDRAIRCALGETNGETIANLDLLTRLSAENRGITNLSGLEGATNLTELDFAANGIADVTPLGGLARLAVLNLAGNIVTNVAPLGLLSNLGSLDLSSNPVNDYSPLSGLGHLTHLTIHDGVLTNLSFLVGLPQLTELNLYNNRLVNISPLGALPNLQTLDLRWNAITNLSLVAQMTNLSRLYLGGNTISNVNFLSSVPGLIFLNLDQNQIRDVSPLSRLTNLTYLVLSHNPITNYFLLANLRGLKSLEVRGNGLNRIGFMSNFVQLAYADLAYNNITNLSPLAGLTNMSLVLDANTNLDRSTFSSLSGLSRVWLNGSGIQDVSFLTNQTGLTALGLEQNGLTDTSFLTHFTNLTHLCLSQNPGVSFDQLQGFTNLEVLRLEGNCISNLTFLGNLANLAFLSVNSNLVSDLTPLDSLTNLSSLYLPHNRVTNISALASLPGIRYVDVSLELFGMGPGSTGSLVVQDLQCRGANVTFMPTNVLVLSVPTAPEWNIPIGHDRALGFFVSDDVVPANELLISSSSSNQEVLPGTSMSLGGTNRDRTLIVTPNTTGTSTLALTIKDAPGGLTAIASILVYVRLEDPDFHIADPILANLISTAVGIPTADLTSVDLLELGNFDANARGITNLEGLEWASNLCELNLSGNLIQDLGPLRGLTALTNVNISDNQVADISALASLTNLTKLDVSLNPLTNGLPLAGLPELSILNLADTDMTNLSFITNLTPLVSLNLATNRLVDIPSLVVLTNLTSLYLQQNRLTDSSSLTNLLSHLTNVDLRLNLLGAGDPAFSILANPLNQTNQPQRSCPLIDIRTNWVIGPNLTSALSFTISDSGPADQEIGFAVPLTSPNLICSNQGGPIAWTLYATPIGASPGSNSIGLIALSATNDVGFSTNTVVTVQVTTLLPINGALLGDPNLIWTNGGDSPWSIQGLVTRNGHPVAQSGALGNSQASVLQTTLSGPGILSFWWKVSSEACCDRLVFTMVDQNFNGEAEIDIEGEIDWQFQSLFVLPGIHTVVWRYYKDSGVSDGLDAGWLDQIIFQPGTWVTLLSSPADGNANLVLYGALGRTYELQVSSNAFNWVGLSPLVVGAAPYVLFTDTNAVSLAARLYRLKDSSVVLDPPYWLNNGFVQLVSHNLSGMPLDLQFSTNLTTWSTLATLPNTRDLTNVDSSVSNSCARFYRAIAHP